MKLDILKDLTQDEFVHEYIAKNRPCIIHHSNFDRERWTPEGLRKSVGHMTTQIYDTLFDLQSVDTLANYIDNFFGMDSPSSSSAPYVRWYNRLKDIDFYWGDEAFGVMSDSWTLPDCIPTTDLLVPFCSKEKNINPVTDLFPYRGILVAAKGARTRLHRDPFCSDAIVNQFYGTKEFVLFHPSNASRLLEKTDGSSFGGFVDIRNDENRIYKIEPDFKGTMEAGDMLYIPHGWLHDVLVLEDSISVTWNFVHKMGGSNFLDYLHHETDGDKEFEILQYFYSINGYKINSGRQVLDGIYNNI